MLYDYTCDRCGARSERITTLAERDALTCDAAAAVADADADADAADPRKCGGKLIRDEDVALTGRTPHFWQP